MTDDTRDLDEAAIAVVGMAGRFPGAWSPDEFWDNIAQGLESIVDYSDDQLIEAGVTLDRLTDAAYVRRGAPLEDFDHFDAEFFGLAPKDAAIMDPQHRVLLEVAWETLESAGVTPDGFDGDIGVFAGCGMNAYMMFNLLTNPELVDEIGLFLLRHTGNDKDFLATRISYALDLTGPSINVQTACSTSLVAIHQAAQSLLSGECDLALAGGSTIELPQRHGYTYLEGEILSPDGRCRPFDRMSEGTVFGSGAGMVALRRYADAVRDGDPVFAVVRGSAINNDGAGKVGYLAPSVDGQAACVAEALAVADVDPSSIQYVEAHGTGTRLGDPIEITALNQAFGRAGGPESIAIGSVKSNIGHLDTAAGIAGVIKAAQALRHRQLPPTLHFEEPNPAIDFAAGPFYVNAELRSWPRGAEPRRAGVSSLGVGGTNAHVVLEEAVDDRPTGPSRRAQLMLLSGRNSDAVAANASRLRDHLPQCGEDLADIAFTLHTGRHGFDVRHSFVARSTNDAISALSGDRLSTHRVNEHPASVTFLFPGGGSQYPDMGLDLYEHEPLYRSIIDEGLAALLEDGLDLRPLLFPDADDRQAAEDELWRPSLQLPAIFLTEYALARLLLSWGVPCHAVGGHSMGENTAACIAGVLSFRDCLGLVALRGRLFETVPAGGMLSVSAPADSLAAELPPTLAVGAHNSPELTVVSGPRDALDRYERQLRSQGIDVRAVPIDIAAHSEMLDPILPAFEEYLRSIELHPPSIPVASNLTGSWLTDAEATDPLYWVRHLRGTVRFADDADLLLKDPGAVLVEVGPGRALSSLARQSAEARAEHVIVPAMRHVDQHVDDDLHLLEVVGRLWCGGVAVDPVAFYAGQQRRRAQLPTYAFQRQRYFIEPGTSYRERSRRELERTDDIDQWLYRHAWREEAVGSARDGEPLRWLIFVDRAGVGEQLAARLRRRRHGVITVHEGDVYRRRGPSDFVLAPEAGEAPYRQLIADLHHDGLVPDRVVHLWTLTTDQNVRPGSGWFPHLQERGFFSLFHLSRAMAEHGDPVDQIWSIITNGLLPVAGDSVAFPEKATLLGPAAVIPTEFPNVQLQTIDVGLPQDDGRSHGFLRLSEMAGRRPADDGISAVVDQVEASVVAAPTASVAGYRNGRRYVRVVEPVRAAASTHPQLRRNGTYLITGGLGGIGLTLAEHLVKEWAANVVLVSRSSLPARDDWTQWLERRGPEDPTSRRIRRLLELEDAPGEIMLSTADVTNLDDMQRTVDQAQASFGAVAGVIHAAGVLSQDLIQLRSVEDIDTVMAPKVQGALVLDRVFADVDLDFMVVMSSTSTLLGATGQVDYAGANAFLDAFAAYRTAKGSPTRSIAWAAWTEVGMAVAAAEGDAARSYRTPTIPLFDYAAVDAREAMALFELRVDTQWVLDEHRAEDGRSVLPGTGHLEYVTLAWLEAGNALPVKISNVSFHTPVAVQDAAPRDGRVRLELGEGTRALIETTAHGSGASWQQHSEARLDPVDAAPPAALDLDGIIARCPEVDDDPAGLVLTQERRLRFGPRWRCLRRIHWGSGEAVAHLQLPEEFRGDVDDHHLHPALLDMATGFGLPLLEGYRELADPPLFVPLSYESVTVHDRLPAEVHSHLRLRAGSATTLARFDVTIADAAGRVLVDVENLTVVALADGLHFDTESASAPRSGAGPRTSPAEEAFRRILEAGIRPDEGWPAFVEALDPDLPAHVFVSPIDLDEMVDVVRTANQAVADRDDRFERPNLGSDYVEPANPTEAALADIWSEFLGIDQIGIDDDFFALGGHSLVAVRMFNAVRSRFGTDYPMSVLFERPTVRTLAAAIAADAGEPPEADAVTASQDPDREPPSFQHVVQMAGHSATGRPFFLVAGMFGNILNLRHVALLLGVDRPFYGLQARGLKQGDDPHETFEEMAAAYISELRQVQPEGPYLLGGFSGGGITAFEMARQLTEAGDEVAMLVLLDTPIAERPMVSGFEKVFFHGAQLRRHGVRYLRDYAKQRVQWQRSQDRSPLTIDPESRSEVIEAAFYRALGTYTTKPWAGDVHLYRPKLSEDLRISGDRLVTENREYLTHDNGWTPFVQGELHIREVPGDHDGMVLEPNVRVLARAVLDDLAAIERRLDD